MQVSGCDHNDVIVLCIPKGCKTENATVKNVRCRRMTVFTRKCNKPLNDVTSAFLLISLTLVYLYFVYRDQHSEIFQILHLSEILALSVTFNLKNLKGILFSCDILICIINEPARKKNAFSLLRSIAEPNSLCGKELGKIRSSVSCIKGEGAR